RSPVLHPGKGRAADLVGIRIRLIEGANAPRKLFRRNPVVFLQLDLGEQLQDLGIFRVRVRQPLKNTLRPLQFAVTDKELRVDDADLRLLVAEAVGRRIAILGKLQAAADLMRLAEQKRRPDGLGLLTHRGAEVGDGRIDHPLIDLDGADNNQRIGARWIHFEHVVGEFKRLVELAALKMKLRQAVARNNLILRRRGAVDDRAEDDHCPLIITARFRKRRKRKAVFDSVRVNLNQALKFRSGRFIALDRLDEADHIEVGLGVCRIPRRDASDFVFGLFLAIILQVEADETFPKREIRGVIRDQLPEYPDYLVILAELFKRADFHDQKLRVVLVVNEALINDLEGGIRGAR